MAAAARPTLAAVPPASLIAPAMEQYEAGLMDEADASCRRLLQQQPGHADALHLRGVIAHRQGRHDVAAALILRAMALDHHNPSIHHNLGAALQALGLTEAAAACFERVVALRPNAAEAFFSLGNLCKEQGRLEAAVPYFQRAVACRPGYADALNNLGLTLLDLGHLAEAAQALEHAVALAPGRAAFYRNLAQLHRFAPGDPHVAAMEALLGQTPALPPPDRVALHFALGKAYADIGDAARSFSHLHAGNVLFRDAIVYDERGTLSLLQRIERSFGAGLMRDRRPDGALPFLPVFVIGMPRSGTTLVEQVLASHPAVHGGGEREEFGRAVQRLDADAGAGFPEGIGAMSVAALRRLGETYVGAMRPPAVGARCVIDKMPRNFLFAGLVHLALPEARIIHVRRDPFDTCASCYARLFSGHHPYSYDLRELGRYYRAYDRLMAHWRTVLPADVMLEVRYEDLIDDFERQTRRMLSHCGLDWDDRCLWFHETRRPVRTASSVQVRQTLSRRGIERWKPYRAMMAPLLGELSR